eukprot:4445379-Prymnesium_polylepis.1
MPCAPSAVARRRPSYFGSFGLVQSQLWVPARVALQIAHSAIPAMSHVGKFVRGKMRSRKPLG